MRKKLIIVFLLIFVSIGLSGQSVSVFSLSSLISGFDEEDEEDAESVEDDAESVEEDTGNFEEDAEEKEEDPFAKKEEPVKDDFVKDDFKEDSLKKDVFAAPMEDDFVVEKREKGKTHRYKEPDLGKVVIPTYLYSESSIKSKKLFELYRNDEVVILDDADGFMRVEFLGKEGWIPIEDVRLEKWYSYRISMEIAGGAASGGGEIKNFDVIGNYYLRLNVAVVQDFIVGLEGRGMSFDTDALYAGGGLMLRYYIHGIRSKKTRSALTAYAGYVGGQERPGNTYEYQMGETQYKVFGGPYVGGSLDYFFRVWEYMAIGLGGDFTYVKLYGKTETANLEKEFYQGGGHLSLMFNILR